MLDFVNIVTKKQRNGDIVISPEFVVGMNKDLMTRGHSFYAVWDEAKKMWSDNEADVIDIIDKETKDTMDRFVTAYPDIKAKPLYLKDFSNHKWNEWSDYIKKSPDNYHQLNNKIIFSNQEVKKEDYATKKLPYPLKEGEHKAYDEIMGTLYSDAERDKLEWAIGAIISGDSKKIQKFIVLYGEQGTGKSTVIDIVEMLFPGYTTSFDAKALGQSSNSFALEPFKSDPLVAIQTDGNLSRIEDNTKLNSIVSHEKMLMNEKHKPQYTMQFHSFIFMASNNPVKITDARSGILRRLIDVSPTGKKLPFSRYEALKSQIQFELGAIAYHCLSKYQKMGKAYYEKYKPNQMFEATNDFYNFVSDNYEFFSEEAGVTLAASWDLYKKYAEMANFQNKCSMRVFKEELRSYFTEVKPRDGGRYNVYKGFKEDKFDYISIKNENKESSVEGCEFVLKLECEDSLFDTVFADCLAQYASDGEDEKPDICWSDVTTKLRDLDTRRLHYVLVPEYLIVVDFDIKGPDGKKDPVANLMAASKFPPTYAEFSKSGGGIHLHYIWDGDVLELSRIFEPGIEVKVFKKKDGTRGFSSLRRKLTKCNNLPIAHINSGLPLIAKGDSGVVSFEGLKNEKAIRTLIMRALNKEYCEGFTVQNISLIKDTLDKAYESGITYDVTDMINLIRTFAAKSTNSSIRCTKMVAAMHFKSKDEFMAVPDKTNAVDPLEERVMEAMGGSDAGETARHGTFNYISKDDDWENAPIVFFDVEVFPNLLVICWKYAGAPLDQTVRMINPTPKEVAELFKFRLIGFNNRRYDNHIIYAASLGYSNKDIFEISQGIITSDKKSVNQKIYTFGAAYNISYTDIYDFASKKQSLKKWEIELGIHHQELGLPWDKPVDESLWEKVAEYCVNDVMATEALFNNRKIDFETRQLLASLSGLSVNDPNRLHITKILVGDDKNPEHEYTDLSTIFPGYELTFDENHVKHNMYRGIDLGFGGYVYGEPGMYTNVALLDVGNMHGASIIALNKFGKYTKNYKEIRDARMAIKSGRFADARAMLDGKLNHLIDEIEALPEGSSERAAAVDALQSALKLILNSTYGIAAATFDNPLRDKRDVNNVIALRGALFMKTLQDEVVARGFKVISVKTDSLKVPEATPEIISFIIDFGRKYGYEFEHECTYEKICLVNDAVYIAKYDDKGVRNKGGRDAGKWTATGAQFQQPFVFKSLFSREPIEHSDVCETKEVSKGGGLYLDMNEGLPEDEHAYQFIGRVGQFCPIKAGCGGGVLVREKDGKYNAVTGTKKEHYNKDAGEEPVYRWLESEVVEKLDKWSDVDFSYYTQLVDAAVSDISKYGDFEWFTSDDPVPPVESKPLMEPDPLKEITVKDDSDPLQKVNASADSDPLQKVNASADSDPLQDFMNIPEDAPEEIPFLPE